VKKYKNKCFKKALVKTKNNKTQSKLDINQRKNNVKSVYEVKQNKIKDKKILLIDDICTTGSTVNECAKVLKKAGAKSVIVATIAYAEKYS
jgi:predicted amidophosphoribosyltransferase